MYLRIAKQAAVIPILPRIQGVAQMGRENEGFFVLQRCAPLPDADQLFRATVQRAGSAPINDRRRVSDSSLKRTREEWTW